MRKRSRVYSMCKWAASQLLIRFREHHANTSRPPTNLLHTRVFDDHTHREGEKRERQGGWGWGTNQSHPVPAGLLQPWSVNVCLQFLINLSSDGPAADNKHISDVLEELCLRLSVCLCLFLPPLSAYRAVGAAVLTSWDSVIVKGDAGQQSWASDTLHLPTTLHWCYWVYCAL